MNLSDKLFWGLNAIRGIAATVVIFSHVDQFYSLFRYKPMGIYRLSLAEDAVTVFFVLSGFLITFLLLREREAKGMVNIRNFYLRRILRIWPVYYIAIFISLFLVMFGVIDMPYHIDIVILLYTFFAANLAYVLGYVIRTITPLWSIGVEEQFYAIWPLIINKSKRVAKSLLILIGLYLAVKIVFWHYDRSGGSYALISLTRISCMAIGGLFSYGYFRNVLNKLLYKKWVQVFSILLITSLVWFQVKLVYSLEVELKAILFAIIILNVATYRLVLFPVVNKIFDSLGVISYGLYAYHMIIIFILSFLLEQFGLTLLQESYFFVLVITFFLSIVLANFSYRLVEQPILKLKERFR